MLSRLGTTLGTAELVGESNLQETLERCKEQLAMADQWSPPEAQPAIAATFGNDMKNIFGI